MNPNEEVFHLSTKALIRNSEGKILVLQCNTKDVRWDLPGGRVQKNESEEESLRREVQEEIGVKELFRITPFVMCKSPIRFFVQSNEVGLIVAAYLCEVADTNSIQMSNEHRGFVWAEPKLAAELLGDQFPEELKRKMSELSEFSSMRG